jgi:acetylglutamate kinase
VNGLVVPNLVYRLSPPAVRTALGQVDGSAVVVHGAGPQITAEMARRGIEPVFVRGRRTTTPDVLAVVCESLEAVNAEVCAAIGPAALGLRGDAIGLRARQVEELGLVGEPEPCAPATVLDALAVGRVPVVAPLAEGPLNVNADEAAAALAVGLGAARILFVSDVPGVLVEGTLAHVLPADEAEAGLDAGAFECGIVPKLVAAVRAARGGVRASIGATEVPAGRARAAEPRPVLPGRRCSPPTRVPRSRSSGVKAAVCGTTRGGRTSTSSPASPSPASATGTPR